MAARRRASASVAHTPRKSPGARRRTAEPEQAQPASSPFAIVGIGASAGGLEALGQLLAQLPSDTGMAFVVVQHLDPGHRSMLPDLLSRATAMPVRTATNGMKVQPNQVYVIPPNTSLAVVRGILSVQRRDPRGQHLPIDHFLQSLASDRGHAAVGVILSGSASDGAVGLQAIKAEGGITFVQDPASAQYDGMPRSALAAGPVDFVLRPGEIASELARIGRHPFLSQSRKRGASEGEALSQESQGLERILVLLRNATGVEFARYKPATIRRRIRRRMVLHRLANLGAYLRYLQSHPDEIEALQKDLLITVTHFFRQTEVLQALKKKVFPRLVKDRTRESKIRIWVPGCSTGEEAYSLAIALQEFLDDRSIGLPAQIFATDVSDPAIERARAGIYPERISADVSPERLQRFFTRTDGSYQVSKKIREMCVFAKQDLTRDPPFSALDLISCCNVLIYLDAAAQKRILQVFHYALKPAGVLVLGTSETVGAQSELFALEDRRHKIYSRRATPVRLNLEFGSARAAVPPAERERVPKAAGDARGFDVEREAERILLSRYTPAGVVVDDHLDILHFLGNTSPYLAPAPGAASLSLMKMVRHGLGPEVRVAVNAAKRRDLPVRKEGLRIDSDSRSRRVAIEVIPVKDRVAEKRGFLVVFDEAGPRSTRAPESSARFGVAPRPSKSEPGRMAGLKQELAATRAYLESLIADHEAANEELKSANEEILSSNEELQSTNEELETAKEELQSVNEELQTVNDELQTRNSDLMQATNDLANLLSSVSIPIVMVGPDLRIRRFTPSAERTLAIRSTDVGRPITELHPNLDLPDLGRLIGDVVENVKVIETEVRDGSGRWHLLTVRPYRTADNRLDGAVLALTDIHAQKMDQARLQEAADYARSIVETVRQPLLVLDHRLAVDTANGAFYEMFHVTADQIEGKRLYELGNGQWDIPALRDALEHVLPARERLVDFEVTHEFPSIGRRTMLLSTSQISPAGEGTPTLILLAIEDVTDRRRAEAEREALVREREARLEAESANRAKSEFLAMLSHELRTPLNVLLGWVWRLRTGRLDEATTARAVETIERNARLQAQLIEDLLDVSSAEVGKLRLELQPVEAASIVKAALEAARPLAEAKQIRLDAALDEKGDAVLADPARLQQIVWNLVSNAIKFTPASGRIEVRFDRAENGIRLAVQDTGVGIRADFLPHIYDTFRQAPGAEHSGLGLGLSIVQRLVRLHEGTIRAESPGEGLGSTFTVTLPLRKPGTKALSRPASARPRKARTFRPLDGVRILLVENDPDQREVFAAVLEQCGGQVMSVESTARAIEGFAEARPDVVVSDTELPGEDGYVLIRRLRSLGPEQGGAVPALALTAHTRPEDRAHALESGFQLQVVKPVDPTELVALVGKLAPRARTP